MPVRLTHEKYIEKVRKVMGDDYVILSQYTIAKNPITVKHLRCGREYSIRADHLTQGKGCKECVNKDQSLSHDDYVERVKKLHGDSIKVLGTYVNKKTKILHECKCGNKFKSLPSNIYDNETSSCRKCAEKEMAKTKTKSSDEYIKNLTIVRNGEYSILEEYKGVNEDIIHKHNECGTIFYASPYDMIHSHKPKLCNHCKDGSLGEMAIMSYLKDKDFKFEREFTFDDCRNILPLRFDFAVFDDCNSIIALIEFDGRQHFESTSHWGGEEQYQYRLKNDKTKDRYCKDNNYDLIRIRYDEINKVSQILENRLGEIWCQKSLNVTTVAV